MKRSAILTAVMLLLLAAPADARQAPVTGLTVHHADCPAYEDGGSCADAATGTIWLAPGAGRFDYWHEVAHVFDHQILDDRARDWLKMILGFPSTDPWLGDRAYYAQTGYGKHALPGEVFADAFAACWMRKRTRRRSGMLVSDWQTAYGYYPTVRQHQRICNAISVYALVHQAR